MCCLKCCLSFIICILPAVYGFFFLLSSISGQNGVFGCDNTSFIVRIKPNDYHISCIIYFGQILSFLHVSIGNMVILYL